MTSKSFRCASIYFGLTRQVKAFVSISDAPTVYKNISKNTRVASFLNIDGTCTCTQCRITSKYAAKYRFLHDSIGMHHDLVYIRDTGKPGIMTIDHILPRSLGGGDKQSNYRVLCDQCNQKRGNRLKYQEFLKVLANPELYIRQSDEGRRKFRQYVEQRYPEKLETLSYILY